MPRTKQGPEHAALQAHMAKLIKARVSDLEMTQADLAKKLGVSPQLVSDWVQERQLPHYAHFAKLSEFLGVSVGYLCMEKPAKGETLHTVAADLALKLGRKLTMELAELDQHTVRRLLRKVVAEHEEELLTRRSR